MTTITAAPARNALTANRLPRWTPLAALAAALTLSTLIVLPSASGPDDEFPLAAAIVLGGVLYLVIVTTLSGIVEGRRRATDRFMTALVTIAFLLAMVPLFSVAITTVSAGLARFDVEFFTNSMRNITGEGGGALHAVLGTVMMTLTAALISVPIGLLTAIYLVEYGRGALARGITFIVDVMTGIPSIVAGLFAYALFALLLGPGVRSGFIGAIALSVLMIPVVVRSSEEMLRLVPNELREASYALGVPQWLTVLKVVLPTSIAGITTGIMLSIARVIGETAPLLVTAGFTASMNYNLFDGRMNSLPLYVYRSYMDQGVPFEAYLDRAWAAALTLIIIVMALNLFARLIAKFFAPKTQR